MLTHTLLVPDIKLSKPVSKKTPESPSCSEAKKLVEPLIYISDSFCKSLSSMTPLQQLLISVQLQTIDSISLGRNG